MTTKFIRETFGPGLREIIAERDALLAQTCCICGRLGEHDTDYMHLRFYLLEIRNLLDEVDDAQGSGITVMNRVAETLRRTREELREFHGEVD